MYLERIFFHITNLGLIVLSMYSGGPCAFISHNKKNLKVAVILIYTFMKLVSETL